MKLLQETHPVVVRLSLNVGGSGASVTSLTNVIIPILLVNISNGHSPETTRGKKSEAAKYCGAAGVGLSLFCLHLTSRNSAPSSRWQAVFVALRKLNE